MTKAIFLILAFSAAALADVKSGKATTAVLNDNTVIPVLGLGTWLNGSTPEKCQEAVEIAIESGYRHIDTAAIYGTELHVGNAVKAKIDDGTVKREDLYITTKLWNTKHAPEKVVPALRQSLKDLKMDYVDLYLIHWPISMNDDHTFNDIDYVDTWKSMEEAQKLGLTKSIGVSNFNIDQLTRLLNTTTVKPVCNQVEVNPNLTQKKLIAYCNERGIKVVAYTPLGSMPESRSKGQDTPAPHLDDPVLQKMGDKYKKSTVQIVLRYLIDSSVIPIPKSLTPSRIRANIDLFDFALTTDEIKQIDGFNLDYRTVNPKVWKDSKYYPF